MRKLGLFAGCFVVCLLVAAGFVYAEEAAASVAKEGLVGVKQWLALGGGVGLGLAAFGCGLGQGKMVSSAMEGIGRNPQAADKMFVPMILGLAFIEALCIYSLIYCILFKAAILG